MSSLDWTLVVIPIALLLVIGFWVRRYIRSVSDFVAGGRLAGRCLLAVSKGEMAAGAVVFAATFERISQAGFTLYWWQWLQVPVLFLIVISGFVTYRYRETRALTLGQFFEIRYSRKFRLFTGLLGFFAGLINFGIIPVVGARFLVYFLQLPTELTVFGHVLPTHIALMGVMLSLSVFLTLSGGLISIMITDCLEGMLSQLIYLVIIAGLLLMFNWPQISETLGNRPPGHSLLNPFDSNLNKDFNLWFVVLTIFVSTYSTMAWQNASAYNAAARTPHESRMANVLGQWREQGKVAVVTLLAVCALTFLQHPHFQQQAAAAHHIIAGISQTTLQRQMTVPIALSCLLPIGLKGLFCALLLMGIFGGDSTHLHSWSSIFIQDVLVPLRRRPFDQKQHILFLRLSVVGVALFAFLFGSFFHQTEYISMWFQVTMGIFVGGAGAVIIGGLYWKKGTTAGAWTAMVLGATLCGGGVLLRQFLGDSFPLNGLQIAFLGSLTASGAYILVSLLTNRSDFDMDRMLHRGRYTLPETETRSAEGQRRNLGWLCQRAAGFDENFTRKDKLIAGGLLVWSFSWCLTIVGISIWNLFFPWPPGTWSAYWRVAGIGVPVGMTIITAVWFAWGGVHDISSLFQRLGAEKPNPVDDGTVVDHQSLSDLHVKRNTPQDMKDHDPPGDRKSPAVKAARRVIGNKCWGKNGLRTFVPCDIRQG